MMPPVIPDDRPSLVARPLRVLHYTTWRERCGIAGYAQSLMSALSAHGVQNDVFPVDKPRFRYFSATEAREHVRQFTRAAADYDLVHVQHEFSFFSPNDTSEANFNFFQAVRAVRRTGPPVVVTWHTEPFFLPPPENTRANLKRRVTLKRPALNWTPGREFGVTARPGVISLVHAAKSRASLLRNGFAPAGVRVIPMGVDARKPSLHGLSREQAKARLGLPAGTVLLSLFGFVTHYKGHHVAVQALRELPPNYVLAVVGGTHPMTGGDGTIDAMFKLWGRRDPARLRITGYVNQDALDLYHAATDVCLAPYVDANLSSSAAITWALSSGRPVVASSIPAFMEINEQSDCLATVTPGGWRELAWEVRRLVADPDRQRRLVANAADHVERGAWPRVAEVVAGVYTDLTGRHLPALLSSDQSDADARPTADRLKVVA